jgi:hypothetical protein
MIKSILVLLLVLMLPLYYAYGHDDNDDDSKIQVLGVFTVPSVVYVGDTFIVGVVIRNDSKEDIMLDGLCYSPLYIQVNGSVIKAEVPKCLAFESKILRPNEVTVVYSDPGVKYIAYKAGSARISIDIEYASVCAEECKEYKHVEHVLDINTVKRNSFIVSIATGESIAMDGEVIMVKSIEDSRCALDVTCVWQGTTTVSLMVSGTEYRVAVGEAIYTDNYSIRVLRVEPYPVQGIKGDTVMLEISDDDRIKMNSKVIGDRLVIILHNSTDDVLERIDIGIDGIKYAKVKGTYYQMDNGKVSIYERIKSKDRVVITAYIEGSAFLSDGKEYCCIYDSPPSAIIRVYTTHDSIHRGFITPVSYSYI